MIDTVFVASPIDSAASVAIIAKSARGFLEGLLPGLDQKVVGMLVTAIAVGCTNLLMVIFKQIQNVLLNPHRIAPILAPYWARFRPLVNGLAVLGIGWLAGGPMVGAISGFLFHFGKDAYKAVVGSATKVTPEGQARARHVGLSILFGALLLGSSAGVADAKVRLVPAAGFAVEHSLDESAGQAKGLFLVQVRAALSDHLNAGVRVAGPIGWTDDEASAFPLQFDWRRPRISYEVLWVF